MYPDACGRPVAGGECMRVPGHTGVCFPGYSVSAGPQYPPTKQPLTLFSTILSIMPRRWIYAVFLVSILIFIQTAFLIAVGIKVF